MHRTKIATTILAFALSCASVEIPPTSLQSCRKPSGIPGPEDFVYVAGLSSIIVSSHERRIPDSVGALYLVPMDSGTPIALPVEGGYPEDFRPHGISAREISKDKWEIYVISHRNEADSFHSIEIFTLERSKTKIPTLKLKESLTSDLLTSPNDLYVLKDGTVFISNDFGRGSRNTKFVFYFFGVKNGNLVIFKDGKFQNITEPVAFGNGVYVTEEGGFYKIFRSSGVKQRVNVYTMSQSSPYDFKLIQEIPIDGLPDNLEPDDKNEFLYTSSHFDSMAFLKHQSNPSHPSPTHLYKINMKTLEANKIGTESGVSISAVSTIKKIGQETVYSQVFNDFILICK